MCFLELNLSDQEIKELGDVRHVAFHCKNYVNIRDDSILAKYIVDLNETPLEEQKQQPNPTIINTVGKKPELGKKNKTVVFTSYKQETNTSMDRSRAQTDGDELGKNMISD